MRTELASLDLVFLIPELKERLLGGIIQKVWQQDKELRLEIFVSGKGSSELYFAPGRFFITEFKRSAPEQPGAFAMILRKHLSGQKVADVRQHGFDRIVELETHDYVLIFELFAKGNAVLCDKNLQIIMPLEQHTFKDRSIRPKRQYVFPPAVSNPLTLELEELRGLLKHGKKEIVKFLATNLSLSGLYAEELLLRASVDKTKMTNELTGEETAELHEQLAQLAAVKQPQLVSEGGKLLDVTPFPLKLYGQKESRQLTTLTSALDEFFTHGQVAAAEAGKVAGLDAERAKLEHRLAEQRAAVERWQRIEQDSRKNARLIETNMELVERVLTSVERARKSDIEWPEIKARAAEGEPAIKEIREKDGKLILEL
jgi:predicted ribosome quality control (RQC) complex YloA/Tae2 family protein